MSATYQKFGMPMTEGNRILRPKEVLDYYQKSGVSLYSAASMVEQEEAYQFYASLNHYCDGIRMSRFERLVRDTKVFLVDVKHQIKNIFGR
jgi:hypothetical protein